MTIQQVLKHLRLNQHRYRYLVVGVSVYLFEMLVIPLSQWLGASPLLAVTISFWLGIGLSFTLQKLITFEDRRMHHRVLVPQMLTYGMLVLFNFGFTLLLTHLLTDLLPTVVIRTLALGITTVWNFYLYKTRIFKNPDNSGVY
jgi:putative flippase GtrA